MVAIVVRYAGSIEGIIVLNEDEVEETLDTLRRINLNNEDPCDISSHPIDTLNTVIDYLHSQ